MLLYNKSFEDSLTMKKLVSSSRQIPNSKIVIWNNGPSELDITDFDAGKSVDINFTFEQTVHNESLSKIYNQFLSKYDSDFYIILDDDSDLSPQYLTSLASLSENCLFAAPTISSDNKFYYPEYKGAFLNQIPEKITEPVFSIGSGLVISQELKNRFFESYGGVFDERFYFYGVDTSIFHRLFINDLSSEIDIIEGFEHSLSRLDEFDHLSSFRKRERSVDMGLQLRWYYSVSFAAKSLVSLLLRNTIRTLFRQPKSRSFKVVLLSYIKGKHYKSKNG